MQLALPITLPVDLTFDNFYCEGKHPFIVFQTSAFKQCNAASELRHQNTTTSHLSTLTLLVGKAGLGKTHLMIGSCHFAEQNNIQSMYLDLLEPESMSPLYLEGIESFDLIAIDNVHGIAGLAEWETALFDMINRVIEERTTGRRISLLVSMKDLPQHCAFCLPDLISRLNWGTLFKLSDYDDAQREKIIQLKSRLKGLAFSDAAVSFLLTRSNRSLHSLSEIVDELDVLSLETKRKITLPILKSFLKNRS